MTDPTEDFRKMAQEIIDNPGMGQRASIRNGKISISLGFDKNELKLLHGECKECSQPKCWCRCEDTK